MFSGTSVFWDKLFQLLYLLTEMPPLSRNGRVVCLVCGRDFTRSEASRNRCGVLKCSNCSFSTYSSEELNVHTEKKHFIPVYS